MFCRDADLFTQQKRASPRDGLITQSTRKAVTAGALFCFVEKPTVILLIIAIRRGIRTTKIHAVQREINYKENQR